MNLRCIAICRAICLLFAAGAVAAAEDCTLEPTGHGAIFFHPDGTSAGHWDAARILDAGPDGRLNWHRLPQVTTYRGHLTDQLASTSNAGAVIHATGTRVGADSFGLDDSGDEIRSADGTQRTIMEQAVACGLGTALVQTGSLIEPGTAAFVAEVGHRYLDAQQVALEVVESGVDYLLGGGEAMLLPLGVPGRFGPGLRTDGRNLIDEAVERGYAVVYSRTELMALPGDVGRVLGVFGRGHTFNDRSEEELAEDGLAAYDSDAPTVAEMTRFVLARLGRSGAGFLAVIEEEGSDNLCNRMNASGCLEAYRRADDAIGVILEFIDGHPDTFMVTASDSNAGGIQIHDAAAVDEPVPARTDAGAPLDGADGTATRPFLSAPDRRGRRFPFAIAWIDKSDLGSGMLARAAGLNAAELLPAGGTANTDIYRMLYYTLFGVRIAPETETQ